MNGDGIDLRYIIEIIKKRWRIIISLILVAIIAGIMLLFFVIKPKYESKTLVFIGKVNSETPYNTSDILLYQQLMKTYVQLASTEDLVASALDQEGIEKDVGTVLQTLTVTPKTDTQILEIKYVSTNAEESCKVTEAVTNAFILMSKELIPDSNTVIIQSAKVPKVPIGPNKVVGMAIAVILGGIISAVVIAILESMDNTFKSNEEIERLFGVPVIGNIPFYTKE